MRGERRIFSGVLFSECVFFDPEFAAGGEVVRVVAAVDGERLAEAGGTAGYVEQVLSTAASMHKRQAIEWLDGANQDGAAQADIFGHAVEAPLGVDHIDVGVPRRAEHRRVAGRHPAIGVTSRVAAAQVGFGLDDAAAAEALRRQSRTAVCRSVRGPQPRDRGHKTPGEEGGRHGW